MSGGIAGRFENPHQLIEASKKAQKEEELEKVNYSPVEIRLTELLSLVDNKFDFNLVESPLEQRYRSYIKAGNKLRELLKRPDAFALLALPAINERRKTLTGDSGKPAKRTAYILDQLKRPEEIETLRLIYGRSFVQISCYSEKTSRIDRLARRMSSSDARQGSLGSYRSKANELVEIDENQISDPDGQRVQKAFPMADVIIHGQSEETIRVSLTRFLRAFFNDKFISPTKDEYGMFLAKAASLRSLDLSRQVGAAIFQESGEVISCGCNEVPKAGGGTYWAEDDHDARDFKRGYDSNAQMKMTILADSYRRLQSSLDDDQKLHFPSEDEFKEILGKNSQIMDILEFGRMIHAEMSALSDAARLGLSVKGGTLYCTTFPCHMCARHIIASGISRVVYIEPYPKSLVSELYDEEVAIEDNCNHAHPKVKIEHFVGITPNLYPHIFSKGKRKTEAGEAVRWNAKQAEPLVSVINPIHILNEVAAMRYLSEIIDKV